MSCVQPIIDNINKTMSHCKHAGVKIKIGKVEDEDDMDNHLNRSREILPFALVDVFTFPSQNMFESEEGKEFIRRHMMI